MGYRLHLAAASLLLVLLAGHRYATVTSEPGGRFEDPDALFHAHRAERAVREGTPLPPVFDRFENFPAGGVAMWPPLHDASLALLARLGGSTRAEPARGMATAAAFPVLELVAALLVAAALAKRVAGPRAGIIAAWLFATAPSLARRGAFGEIDHNVTEVLGALLLLTLAMKICDNTNRGKKSSLLFSSLWAAGVLLALGFYAGLVMAAGLVTAAAVAAELGVNTPGEGTTGDFLESNKEERARRGLHEPRGPRNPLAVLAAGFAIAAAVLPLFAGLRVRPDPADPWRLGPVYVLILATAAAGTGVVSAFSVFTIRRKKGPPDSLLSDRLSVTFSVGSVLAAFILFALSPRAAWHGLFRGLGFIGARDPWLFTIDEFRPLFTAPEAVLAALPVLPVALVALAFAFSARRRLSSATRRALVFLAVPFLLYALLAAAQKRFLPVAAAFGAAGGGAAWALVAERAAARWSLRALGAAGLGIAATSFLIPYLAATLRNEPAPQYIAGEEAASAVKALTPEPGDPPAWGVLAPWDYGHDILQRASRPVALNNFGNFQPGFERATRVFLETSPEKAVAELDRLKLRYVVAAWGPNVVPSAAASLGEDPARYFVGGWSPDRMTPYTPTPLGERTLLLRLHLHDGLPFPEDTDGDRRALARLRKVWESPEPGPGPAGRTLPFMKLFEVVSAFR